MMSPPITFLLITACIPACFAVTCYDCRGYDKEVPGVLEAQYVNKDCFDKPTEQPTVVCNYTDYCVKLFQTVAKGEKIDIFQTEEGGEVNEVVLNSSVSSIIRQCADKSESIDFEGDGKVDGTCMKDGGNVEKYVAEADPPSTGKWYCSKGDLSNTGSSVTSATMPMVTVMILASCI